MCCMMDGMGDFDCSSLSATGYDFLISFDDSLCKYKDQ
jgi:hypothetical protein